MRRKLENGGRKAPTRSFQDYKDMIYAAVMDQYNNNPESMYGPTKAQQEPGESFAAAYDRVNQGWRVIPDGTIRNAYRHPTLPVRSDEDLLGNTKWDIANAENSGQLYDIKGTHPGINTSSANIYRNMARQYADDIAREDYERKKREAAERRRKAYENYIRRANKFMAANAASDIAALRNYDVSQNMELLPPPRRWSLYRRSKNEIRK